jgi:hypothetical protein
VPGARAEGDAVRDSRCLQRAQRPGLLALGVLIGDPAPTVLLDQNAAAARATL